MSMKAFFSFIAKRCGDLLDSNKGFSYALPAYGGLVVAWNEKTELLSVQADNTTVKEVLNYIEKHSNYIFVYSQSVQNSLNKRVSISVSNKKVDAILKELSDQAGFDYSISGRQVTITMSNRKAKSSASSIRTQSSDRFIVGKV